MKITKLPFNFGQHPAPNNIKTIDSIMIHSRSRGTLNAGQFSEKEPPKGIEIKIAATSSEKVKWETKMLGSKERYTLIYEISNRSDSPAFAYLARKVD